MLRKIISAGAGVGLTASTLVVGGVTATQATPPSATNPANSATNPANNAAAWLAKQNPGTAGGPLTSNIIALTASGVGKTKSQEWLSTLEANINPFIADGPGKAGSLAKSIYTVEVQEEDSANFGGNDMPAELRALMVDDGANKGRFQVDETDYSSGLTQAWAVLGLARTSGGVPADAVNYLLGLQCENGGFAAAYNSSGAPNWTPEQYRGICESNDEVDIDTTSMALQALLAPANANAGGAEAAWAKAANYLVSIQNSDGSFSDPWFGPNSNTTGLAAQALRAAGRNTQANKATAWLNSMQLTCVNAASAAAVQQIGAVAYDQEALEQAKKSGISSTDRTQWTMAAQQVIGGMAGSNSLGVASAADQAAGLPAAKCAVPNAPIVTKLSFAANGKTTVYFKAGLTKSGAGKVTGYKYRLSANGKSWGSWRSLSGNATKFDVTKTQVKAAKPASLKARYVEIVAANNAGTSTGATARIAITVSKLSQQGKCTMPRIFGVTFGSSSAKVAFGKTRKDCVKVRATGATKWKKLKKDTSHRTVKVNTGQTGYLELLAGKARNKVVVFHK